ncbi:peptidoglycan-binding protein [Kitasatospora sp. NPDC056076]|uniref:peptidoglycan-binding protein n=1 Tax=Kitasatospora sp. NPDC056076 TaxID=3345703 RepID=UPI0035DD0568
MAPQWQQLTDHVMNVPERIYEGWNSSDGWDNITPWGAEFGENGVSWCVIWAWDMFHDLGLDDIVPRTDNVSVFTDWARAHGQWSEYPSVGSWTNFGNGQHCEVVIGFDSRFVYTKGGNSVADGATDRGQGNGVWSHSHLRTDSYVTGYLAPHFGDGVCPPTADPADPRGGPAVTEWRWSPAPDPTPSTPAPSPDPAPAIPARYQVTIGGLAYGYGAEGAQVTRVGEALVAAGFGQHYAQGPGPTWTDADTLNYADFQRSIGYTGADADGVPGEASLQRLLGDQGAGDEPFPGAGFFHPGQNSDVITRMGRRLVAVGCSHYRVGPGPSWGAADQASYAAWQRQLGYTGSAADGIPGQASWEALHVPAA